MEHYRLQRCSRQRADKSQPTFENMFATPQKPQSTQIKLDHQKKLQLGILVTLYICRDSPTRFFTSSFFFIIRTYSTLATDQSVKIKILLDCPFKPNNVDFVKYCNNKVSFLSLILLTCDTQAPAGLISHSACPTITCFLRFMG